MEQEFKFWYDDCPVNKDMIKIWYDNGNRMGGFSGIDYRKDINSIMEKIDRHYEFEDFTGDVNKKKIFIEQFLNYFNNDEKFKKRLDELMPVNSRYLKFDFRKTHRCDSGNLVIDKEEYPELNGLCDKDIFEYLSNSEYILKNKDGQIINLLEEFTNKSERVFDTEYDILLSGQNNIGELSVELVDNYSTDDISVTHIFNRRKRFGL